MNHFRPNNFRANLGKSDCRRAFTLIEILIVVALTAVLFTLMLIPLVSALNYTRQSQLLTAAQDAARITREMITRELGSALYVFDNTSHPFLIANDPKIPGEDKYTNFLDLQILDSKGNPVIAHAYNAKLDIVQPKINEGTIANPVPIDPTTHQPITYSQSQNGSAIISSPALIFPAAAGTTMTRYWTGLKDPTKSYNNTREGAPTKVGDNSIDNTYVLYRAQFKLSNDIDPKTGNPAVNQNDPTSINENLFAPQGESDGAVTVKSTPELDDPDFFRYVSATDVNWLSKDHHTYTQGEITTHNKRVDNWVQIAKPVIPGPTIDLVLQPHYSNGKLAYDQSGVAHSGIAHDPISNTDHPIVSSSVTFRPGTVSGNATPATTNEYSSQGVVSGTDQNGYSYVPTIYTTTNQSWVKPYVITLTPPIVPANSGQTVGGITYTISQDPATNDYIEYTQPPNNGTPVAVFDVTKGTILSGATTGSGTAATTSYIPLTVNADTGIISFDVPALPNPQNAYVREWVYTPTKDTDGTFFVDLKANDDNSSVPQIGTVVDPTYPNYALNTNTDTPLYTARVVPGSLRVYGPDGTPGSGQGEPVLYTETGNVSVPGNDPQKGDNRYFVDYSAGIIHFEGNASQLAVVAPATTLPVPIKVIYNYQANVAPVGALDANNKMPAGYALQPMGVSVDYQTRDLISLSLGVRIFDISTGVAQVIPSETKIKIGNSNR